MAAVIFTVFWAVMFGTSATYHVGTLNPKVHQISARTDHANIYLVLPATFHAEPVSLVLGRRVGWSVTGCGDARVSAQDTAVVGDKLVHRAWLGGHLGRPND